MIRLPEPGALGCDEPWLMAVATSDTYYSCMFHKVEGVACCGCIDNFLKVCFLAKDDS